MMADFRRQAAFRRESARWRGQTTRLGTAQRPQRARHL